MPSSDLSDDELRDIVREESQRAVRSELKSYGYGVVGLVVGFVGLPLVLGAVFTGNSVLVGVAVLAVAVLTAFLLW
ncbi:hypothetical protein SAMN04487949_0108 [Halogranum gelatinilyticum]|uniref:Uncharacterized protein n=1 Tax=Halogranum gelatinilyticum TaxID=660521 RepID=A0A1G9NUI8_9EURY|nr:hypothetical protein [Halogranum gelatinilyticum]SDL89973.1 hypothetical protein SAMN04487949_0108 [Halogranum gelatinilyticum]